MAAYLARGASRPPRRAVALMAPHAGYVYSGDVAGQVFAAAEIPDRVVVLAPNHTGQGAPIAVWDEGSFALPGRTIPIDEELAAAILREVPEASADRAAHRMEHAVEVELPFLAARNPAVRVVPIVLGLIDRASAVELGRGLSRAVDRVSGDVLVVASSDMSHYLSDDEARRIDQVALEPLLANEPERLYRTIREQRISMCGFIPATAMLAYAAQRGTRAPELLAYATSGDASGDRGRVVGYAGVAVWA